MGLLTSSPLKSSLLRCITSLFQRLFPVTMLVSTSRTSPSRTSSVVTSHPTQRTSPPVVWLTSLLISPASSQRSRRRLIVVQVSLLRIIPSSSSLEMLLSWCLCLPSPCVLSPSASSLLYKVCRQGCKEEVKDFDFGATRGRTTWVHN